MTHQQLVYSIIKATARTTSYTHQHGAITRALQRLNSSSYILTQPRSFTTATTSRNHVFRPLTSFSQLSSSSTTSSTRSLYRLQATPRQQNRSFSAKQGEQQQQQQQSSEPDAEGEATPGQVALGIAVIFGTAGLAGYIVYRVFFYEPPPKAEGEVEDEYTQGPWYTQGYRWVHNLLFGSAPILPPEQPDAVGRRPRTIVVSFDKALVHCEWNRERGWEVRKRPGVDQFIERLHQAGYELVLWANLAQFEVEPVLGELDPGNYFKYKLYNESTNFKWVGAWPQLVKDLKRLRRDPKRLIVIDTSSDKYGAIDGYDNVMRIPNFVDDIKDRELSKVLRVLEDIKLFNVHDVTQVIKKWNESPNADLFVKEKQAAEEAKKHLLGERAGRRSGKKEKEEKNDTEATKETNKEQKQGWIAWAKSYVTRTPTTTKA